jgi:hypothetical protein
LPLNKGKNELTMAIANNFYGWGAILPAGRREWFASGAVKHCAVRSNGDNTTWLKANHALDPDG